MEDSSKWKRILDIIERTTNYILKDLYNIEIDVDDELHQRALSSRMYVAIFLENNHYRWIASKVPIRPFEVPDCYKGCVVEREIKIITNKILAERLSSKLGFDISCHLRDCCEHLTQLFLKMFVNPVSDEEKHVCNGITAMVSSILR